MKRLLIGFLAAAVALAATSCRKELTVVGRWDASLDVTHAEEGTYGNLAYHDRGDATLYFTSSTEGKCMVHALRRTYLVGRLLDRTDTVDFTVPFTYKLNERDVTMTMADGTTLTGTVDDGGDEMASEWQGNQVVFKRQ